jgi:hypothetical protein
MYAMECDVWGLVTGYSQPLQAAIYTVHDFMQVEQATGAVTTVA